MGDEKRRVITLLTDFGLSDPFVGVIKGVILRVNPQAVIVDLCHTVTPCEPSEAAFLLLTAYRYFPEGTIHLAVVDPGVGGSRRPILVKCNGHLFVGPDNGLFAPLADRDGPLQVWTITATRYRLSPVSATFHGRDIFAPAAAYLSLGVEPDEFGEPIEACVRLTLPRPVCAGATAMTGTILHTDCFGNLITNLTKADLERLGVELPLTLLVYIEGVQVPVVSCYDAVPPGALGAVMGSSDFLEIFVNQGDAARLLSVGRGTDVVVERPDAVGMRSHFDRLKKDC